MHREILEEYIKSSENIDQVWLNTSIIQYLGGRSRKRVSVSLRHNSDTGVVGVTKHFLKLDFKAYSMRRIPFLSLLTCPRT